MKTNLDKAKDLINENKFEVIKNTTEGKKVKIHINSRHAFQAVELAAKPNWNYPQKCEDPEKTGYYLVVLEVNNETVYKVDFWTGKNFELFDFYVIAWCELPTFNK